jgi:hypothetical protein
MPIRKEPKFKTHVLMGYVVVSRVPPSYAEKHKKVHGIRFVWSDPEPDRGAVQLRDDVLSDFYKRKCNALVAIEKCQFRVDEKDLVVLGDEQ